jgi:hypothetical protein
MKGLDKVVFQYIVMMKQIILEKTFTNFISDRTVFDVMSYSE